MKYIKSFTGPYRFLSNFWYCVVYFEGDKYISVEHAYQAAKTLDPEERRMIRKATTPKEAKRLGYHITLRKDWYSIRLDIMRYLIEQKFTNNIQLALMLVRTGEAVLQHGNHHGDTFWGICNGVGTNHLGLIIMDTRSKIRSGYFGVELKIFTEDI